jgi:hypothetical protein
MSFPSLLPTSRRPLGLNGTFAEQAPKGSQEPTAEKSNVEQHPLERKFRMQGKKEK